MAVLSQPWRERRLPRVILIAFISTVSVAAVLFGLPWIGLFITPSFLRKATIVFLVGLEVAYVVVLAVLLAGTTICCALLGGHGALGRTGTGPRVVYCFAYSR